MNPRGEGLVFHSDHLGKLPPGKSAAFEFVQQRLAALRWDSPRHQHPKASYLHRLSDEIKRRSRVAPGTPDGPFRLLYLFDRESLAEIENATVHAFLSAALIQTELGYRLYWAVYVKPVSWLTPFYMTLIEPFRRFIVYPTLLRRLRQAWQARYAS